MGKIEFYIDQNVDPVQHLLIMPNSEEKASRMPIICWKDYENSQGNILKNLRKLWKTLGIFCL